MPYTQEQSGRLLEEFWNEKGSLCPQCQALLTSTLDDRFCDGTYRIWVVCDCCGTQEALQRENDPKRDSFRPWVATDLDSMADSYHRIRSSECPVCTAPVTVNVDRNNMSIDLLFHCERCDNDGEVSRPYADVAS